MDGGFRSPRPGERRPERRPSQVQQPAAPHQTSITTEVAPQYAQTTPRSGSGGGRGRQKLLVIIGLVVVALLLAGLVAWLVIMGMRGSASSSVDKEKYQAVFLETGQIYFGKLEVLNGGYMKLSNVFYIQPNATAGDGETQSNTTVNSGDMKLIKLGDEVHGPEDEMIINRDQVSFFENLKPNSKVSELINQYRPGGN